MLYNFNKCMCIFGFLCLLLLQACTDGDKVSLGTPKREVQTPAPEKKKDPTAPTLQNTLAMNEVKKTNDMYDGVHITNPMISSSIPKKEMESRILGEVSAIRNSKIAFRNVGFIENVEVKPGALVKKGQVLASLDDRDFALRFALAKARRDQARVSMESSKKELDREGQLKKEHASTESAFDKIKATYDQSALSFKLSEIELAIAELALKDTKLVAPYDCVVSAQMKYEGENVPAGTAVLEVYDTSEPEITLLAPERLMSTINIGGQMSISIPSANYTGRAEVIRIVPVVSQKTRTFQITAKLLQYNAKVVPGSYVEAVLN